MTAEPHLPATVTLRPSRPRPLSPVQAEPEPPQSRHTVRHRETHRTGPLLPHVAPPPLVAWVLWGCVVVAAVATTVRLLGVLF